MFEEDKRSDLEYSPNSRNQEKDILAAGMIERRERDKRMKE